MVIRRVLIPVLGLVLLVVAGLASAADASAFGGGQGPPVVHVPSPPPGGSNGTHKTGVVRTCSIYGDASGFGLDCLGGAAGGGETIAQILDGSKLPTCWDVPFTPAQLAQVNPPEQDKFNYYMEYCLKGVNPNLTLTADGFSFIVGNPIKALPKSAPACPSPVKPKQDPSKCRLTLDAHQQALVDTARGDQQIPYPLAVETPDISRVRVNETFAFHDTPDDTHTSAVLVGPINAGGVEMRAVMTSFTVYPLGDGTAPLVCPDLGTATVKIGDTPLTNPAGCWYTYLNSSADQPNQVYTLRVEAHWKIQTDTGAGWSVFNQFDKWTYMNIPVTEIQSLVIN